MWSRKPSNPFATSNVKPSPKDDSYPGDGYFDAGWQNGGTDDDNYHPHALDYVLGHNNGDLTLGYYPGYATLWGSYFRIGYRGYLGIDVNNRMQAAESDTTIGMPTIMRPPIIPRRSVTPSSVRNAITFVQSMPYDTWQPIIPPLVSRR